MSGGERDIFGRPVKRQVYFEYVQLGRYIKMMAIDAETGLEVSIMGPLTASQQELEKTALQKLNAQLAKRGS